MKHISNKLVWLLLLATAIGWACSAAWMPFFKPFFPPPEVLAYRNLFGSIAALIFMLFGRKPSRMKSEVSESSGKPIFRIMVVCYTITTLGFFLALGRTNAAYSQSSFYSAMLPTTAIVGWAVAKRRFTAGRLFLVIGTTLCSLFLLSAADPNWESLMLAAPVIGGAAFGALTAIGQIVPRFFSQWSYIFGGFTSVAVIAIHGLRWHHVTLRHFVLLVIMGLMNFTAPLFSSAWLVTKVPATRIALVLSTVPIIAIGMGLPFGDTPNSRQIAAAACIAVLVVISEYFEAKRPPAPVQPVS